MILDLDKTWKPEDVVKMKWFVSEREDYNKTNSSQLVRFEEYKKVTARGQTKPQIESFETS